MQRGACAQHAAAAADVAAHASPAAPTADLNPRTPGHAAPAGAPQVPLTLLCSANAIFTRSSETQGEAQAKFISFAIDILEFCLSDLSAHGLLARPSLSGRCMV